MSHRHLFLLQLVILFVVISFIGCQKESGSDTRKSNNNQNESIVEKSGTVDEKSNATTAQTETQEKPQPLDLATLPPLIPRPGADARKLLEEMVKAYKDAKSYADYGYAEIKFQQPDGTIGTDVRNCTFAYIKPNKVRMEIHRGQLVSDGTLFTALASGNSELFGQVIEKRAPVQTTIKDLYSDFHLAGLMDLGVPPEVIFFPPQIVLLFANDPLQTLVPEGADIFMGQPDYVLSRDGLSAYRCDKVEVVDKLTGRRTYWIEWDTHILMRMEIDAERIRDAEVKPLAFKIELQDAVIDAEIGSEAFVMHKPLASSVVPEFVLPEHTMLGKVPDGTICFDTEKQAVMLASPTQKNVTVAVLFVIDPQAADVCQAALQSLQQLSQAYRNNTNVLFFPISVDPNTVSDTVIAETLKSWGITLTYLRQPDQEMMTRLGLTDVPTVVILGPNGLLQFVNTGVLPSKTLGEFVDSALAGNNPYQSVLNLLQNLKTDFRQAMDNFVSYDIFRIEPEYVQIAEQTEPKIFTLTERWRRDDLVSPGNPHIVDGSLLIPHDFQKISVLRGTDGKTLEINENHDPATVIPEGIPSDMPLHFLRNASAPNGQRYFVATGINQRQLFVFDENLKQVMTWPQAADVGNFEIAAVQMADLNNDETPEIVVGYRVQSESTQRLAAIDLSGKTLWVNDSVTEPDQVIVVQKNKVPHIWVVNRFYDETNSLVEFDAQGQKLREWHIDPVGGLIWKIFAADLNGDGNSEVLAVLPREGEIVVAGINADSRVGSDASQKPLLWENAISPGSHGVKSFEFVTSGDVNGDTSDEWCVAAADGTIYFIDQTGKLLDGFASGQQLSGMAIVTGGKDAFLVLTTSKDNYENNIAQDAVIAWEMVRTDTTSPPTLVPETPTVMESPAPLTTMETPDVLEPPSVQAPSEAESPAPPMATPPAAESATAQPTTAPLPPPLPAQLPPPATP